jgi:hypothetical protein
MKLSIFIAAMTLLTSYANAEGNGFGTDQLFNNLTASPNLIAHQACPDFNISAGESLQVTAEENAFFITGADGSQPVVIQVPGDGNYVFEGQSPNRYSDEIVSKAQDVKASMNPDTTDITVVKLESHSTPCTLTRCPFYGPCN